MPYNAANIDNNSIITGLVHQAKSFSCAVNKASDVCLYDLVHFSNRFQVILIIENVDAPGTSWLIKETSAELELKSTLLCRHCLS